MNTAAIKRYAPQARTDFIAAARQALEKRVEQMGFAQAMEQAAYSWFNRLCAIRYMELKGFSTMAAACCPTQASPATFNCWTSAWT